MSGWDRDDPSSSSDGSFLSTHGPLAALRMRWRWGPRGLMWLAAWALLFAAAACLPGAGAMVLVAMLGPMVAWVFDVSNTAAVATVRVRR